MERVDFGCKAVVKQNRTKHQKVLGMGEYKVGNRNIQKKMWMDKQVFVDQLATQTEEVAKVGKTREI